MKENIKSKKRILIILLIFVVALGVGFAAFSTTLKINGNAKVKPKADNFNVHFASAPIGSDNLKSVIEPSSVSEGAEGSSANISELEFSDAVATFSENGQTVKYDFYVVNEGKYDAYLTNVDFEALNEEGKFKVCDYISDSQLSVDACKGIYVLVKIGEGDEQVVLRDTGTISNHKLEVNESEPVSVIISYASGAVLSDEEFEVVFGNIDLTFRTTDEKEDVFGTSSLYGAPLLIDEDDSIEIGTEFKIGPEHFYVIEIDDENGTVTGLAKHNLAMGVDCEKRDAGQADYCDAYTPANYARYDLQDERFDLSEYRDGERFSTYSYWHYSQMGDSIRLLDRYIPEPGNQPFVFDKHAGWLYDHLYGVDDVGIGEDFDGDLPGYYNLLNGFIVGKIEKVSLMSYEQFVNLKKNYGDPDWLYTAQYWLGSAPADGYNRGTGSAQVFYINPKLTCDVSEDSDKICLSTCVWDHGVRPTVTIKKELFNELD